MVYLLGIDIGTTGAKTILIDEDGKLVSSYTKEYPLYTPHPNWAEQEPDHWWGATVESIREVLKGAEVKPESVVGIGISGQMHSSVLLDSDDRVIRPAILWCDTRTQAQCQWITNKVGVEKLRESVSNLALRDLQRRR